MDNVQCKNCQWVQPFVGNHYCEWHKYNMPDVFYETIEEKRITRVDLDEFRTCYTYRRADNG